MYCSYLQRYSSINHYRLPVNLDRRLRNGSRKREAAVVLSADALVRSHSDRRGSRESSSVVYPIRSILGFNHSVNCAILSLSPCVASKTSRKTSSDFLALNSLRCPFSKSSL